MKDVKEFDEADALRLEGELQYFYSKRAGLLGVGLGLIGTALFLPIIISFFLYVSSGMINVLIIATTICIPLFIAGIIVLILRSALYNSRINNRRLLLRQYEYYQKTNTKKVDESDS